MRNVLVLDAGANYGNTYKTHEANYYRLDIKNLRWKSLSGYDILIVPAWSDEEKLESHSGYLTTFMRRGGILIAYGCHSMEWFGYLRWEDGENPNKQISTTDEGVASGIFSNVELDYAKWHSTLVTHGHFAGCETNGDVFMVDDRDKPVVVRVNHGSGAGLFMTLDPDFHEARGPFIRAKAEERKEAASKIIRGSIEWADREFSTRHTRFKKMA